MSTSESSTTEAQDPTPGTAQRSENPSKEKAMGSSEGSTSHPKQEDAMSADPGSTPSSTTSDGASNGSTTTPTAEGPPATGGGAQDSPAGSSGSKGSKGTTSTDGKKKKKEKRKTAGRYLGTSEKDRAAKALDSAKGDSRAAVVADRAAVEARLQDLQRKQTAVLGHVGTVAVARGRYEAAMAELKPALFGAMWTLRTQPGGRAFVKSLQGADEVDTAKNVVTQVPGSKFRLAAEVLNELRASLPAAEAARKAFEDAEVAERNAAAPYTEALTSLSASVSMLNGTLSRLKQAQRVKTPVQAAAAQSTDGALQLAKRVAAHSKKKVA